jgi:hypothetical protein
MRRHNHVLSRCWVPGNVTVAYWNIALCKWSTCTMVLQAAKYRGGRHVWIGVYRGQNCRGNGRGLRYKLRMMGIPIISPMSLLCDNQSVVISSTRPESTLSKEHDSIPYHRVRESHAGKTLRMGHVESDQNRSACLPSPLWKSSLDTTVRWS